MLTTAASVSYPLSDYLDWVEHTWLKYTLGLSYKYFYKLNLSLQVKLEFTIGNCDIFVKQKISVINETKWDEILLKPKVYDWENLQECGKLSLKL
jgi:hypothetical protein